MPTATDVCDNQWKTRHEMLLNTLIGINSAVLVIFFLFVFSVGVRAHLRMGRESGSSLTKGKGKGVEV
jgi:hypothetical protein